MNETLTLSGIIWEDLVNYKKISTTLMYPRCDFKCNKEYGYNVCQNEILATAAQQTLRVKDIIDRHMKNPITEAIVLQGLEPLYNPLEVYIVSAELSRRRCYDDLVIYTGYNKDEVPKKILNDIINTTPGRVIIKWGRYIPGHEKHFDEVLGVYLASDNQYAEVMK